jgi:hypothetical protein
MGAHTSHPERSRSIDKIDAEKAAKYLAGVPRFVISLYGMQNGVPDAEVRHIRVAVVWNPEHFSILTRARLEGNSR